MTSSVRQRRAALRQRYRVDMVRFGPGAHDVRVEHGGWVSPRAGRALGRAAGRAGALPDAQPDPACWKTGEPVVVHREVLEAGEHPARRVDELAAEVRDGRWEGGEE